MLGASASPCRPEQLLEHLPQIIWSSRPDGFTTFVNRYGREYLGAELPDLLGWGWLRCVHPADVARTLEAWSDTTTGGRAYDVECRMRLASGDYRWQHCRAEAAYTEDGTLTHWIGTCIEIERWKQHEHHLRSANRQIDETVAVLSLLENHATVGFGLVDSSFRFIRVNEALAEINGVPRCEHFGRTVESLLPQLWQTLRPVFDLVLKTQEPVLDFRIRGETSAHSDERRHWLASSHPVVFGDEFLGIGMIVRETTAQKRIEQQLHDLLAAGVGGC